MLYAIHRSVVTKGWAQMLLSWGLTFQNYIFCSVDVMLRFFLNPCFLVFSDMCVHAHRRMCVHICMSVWTRWKAVTILGSLSNGKPDTAELLHLANSLMDLQMDIQIHSRIRFSGSFCMLYICSFSLTGFRDAFGHWLGIRHQDYNT